ncbi:MAG TPA: sulfotransferase family 2 domain-containing protein [Solirubrobacteraceae bacterium]|nr:sulfotransferase family 2 domain-containing protein [Solirubrobacteraceae bacterium]
MRREQLPPHPTATYVMRRWHAMYISVNKAACTSLKWLVADLQNEKPEKFAKSMSRELTRTMTVHRRNLWKRTPMAKQLSDEKLAKVNPEDWFIFAVVRHPTARLFSAWQSKLLLREPWWVEQFGHEPWFPRIPRSGEDVVEDFVRFVRAAREDPQHTIMQNRHFAPQPWMLATDRMEYTRIYKTTEIPQLLQDFERHLRARRWSGNPLSLRRANETPLKPIPSLFGPEVLAAVSELYATDFAELGYSDPMPTGLDPADEYTEPQLAEVERLIERAERINDLALRGQKLKKALNEARADAQAREAARHRWLKAMRRSAGRAKRRLTGAGKPSEKQLPRPAGQRSQNGLKAVREPAPDRKGRAKEPAR